MTTPLVSSARLTLQYVVSGFVHHMRMYAVVNTIGTAGSSTLVPQYGITPLVLSDVAASFGAAVTNLVTPDGNAGDVTLETRAGSVWTVRDGVSGVAMAGGGVALGWQATAVLRAADNSKIKAVVLEGRPGILYHTVNPIPGITSINDYIAALLGTDADPNGMNNWVVSRSEQPIKLGIAFVGFTGAPNRKIRRDRGLA